MGRSNTLSCLGYIILWFVGVLRTTDGSVTWYEPLPVETISDHSVDHTANKVQAREGFPKALSWNFSFTSDLSFNSLTINLDNTVLAGVLSSGQAGVQSGFTERFNFSWIPRQKFTLIIFNVTADDNATFTCVLTLAEGFGTNPWESRIEVNVVDPPSITDISGNQTVNEGDEVKLNCTADGKPTPKRVWTRVSNNSVVTMPLTISGKQDEGAYRCTAKNAVGNESGVVYIIVENYRPINTNVTTDLIDNTVVVNTNFNLTCSAQANPPAKYQFYREQESLFNTTTERNVAVYTTSVSERIDEVKFSCTPFNDFGDGTTVMTTVTVHYPPEIVTAPSPQQVVEGDLVTLFCNTTGNPPPNIAWTKQGSSTVLSTSETHSLTNLRREDNGAVYKCKVQNNLGSKEVNATITVLFKPNVTIQQCSTPVTEGGNATLQCSAPGNPVPSTAWIRASTREVVSYNEMLILPNIKRNESGSYDCLAWNSIGNNTKRCTIDVQYPPKVTSPKGSTKEAEKGATIECHADGNPSPMYVWRNGTGGVVANAKTFVLTYDGNFTCNASNDLGSDTHSIVIESPSNSHEAKMTVEKRNGEVVHFTAKYKDSKNPATQNLSKELVNEVDKVYTNDSTYNRTIITEFSNGSVIVSFVMYFTTPVTESEGFAKLRAAVKNGTLGPFTVRDLKIIQNVNPASTSSVLPTATTTVGVQTDSSPSEPPCEESLFKDAECDVKMHMVVIIAVCGVLVIGVIGGATYYWVRKRRKCRKDPRIHHSDDQEVLQSNQSGVDENACSRLNGGYADSGPPSAKGIDTAAQQQKAGANGTDAPVQQQQQEQVQGAPPTYAVVAKSTKKKKKEEEKRKKKEEKRKKEEEKKKKKEAEQNTPQYAVVDKSQKKKKEVVEDAYAQVDMSKKSKKKPKPGEMFYADLGDFKPREMPAVSTSPEPLPPIKRPPAYQETQYADITQFLKGDATLPDANNSQGTEMTYANVEGGKGTPNENANEEKPKETANGGGNEVKPKGTPL